MKIEISNEQLDLFQHIIRLTGEDIPTVLTNALNEYKKSVEARRSLEEELVVVYLSINKDAPEDSVKKIKAYLDQYEGLSVRWYEEGSDWDSYVIKNADVIIIIPGIHHFERYLGTGTRREAEIAISHDRIVILYDPVKELFFEEYNVEKIEGSKDPRKKYWVKPVEDKVVNSLHNVFQQVREHNKTYGRRVFFKDVEEV